MDRVSVSVISGLPPGLALAGLIVLGLCALALLLLIVIMLVETIRK